MLVNTGYKETDMTAINGIDLAFLLFRNLTWCMPSLILYLPGFGGETCSSHRKKLHLITQPGQI
jgi:hypothetical protein